MLLEERELEIDFEALMYLALSTLLDHFGKRRFESRGVDVLEIAAGLAIIKHKYDFTPENVPPVTLATFIDIVGRTDSYEKEVTEVITLLKELRDERRKNTK